MFYAGVFVLLTLTAEVMIGLVSTDRIVMSPQRRVTLQAVHRSVAFGAMSFLAIHIATEVAAGRSGPADVLIPFLDHGRTFYLGLGTVASDLMILIAVTGIYRARLAANMSPLAWRVLHCTAYAAWLMGIVHGLLAGRPAKTFFGFSGFVAWSYGGCVAAVGIALVVRFVATDRTGQAQGTQSQPIPERPAPPWTAAALAPGLGQAGFGATPLAVTPARPYQRALPAGAATAAPPASLPAGRDWAGDSEQFGQDDTRASDFGRDLTRADFGRDEAHSNFARGETRADFGRDEAHSNFARGETRADFSRAETRADFGRDGARGNFGPGATGGHYVQDDPRASYGRDDSRAGFVQDDPRASYGRDDSRAGFVQDDPRGNYAQDDPGGRYDSDVRGRYAQDDRRGNYGRDDSRPDVARDDPRGNYVQDDPRGRYDSDEAPSFEDDFTDRDVTGPLRSVPFSRYGKRS